MKAKILRYIIEWLYRQYPYLMQEIVVGHGFHKHANPQKRKLTAVVNFPEAKDGTK